jgi:hypothetical protein
MKNIVKLFGIIALVAVMGLTVIACSKGGGSGGGGKLSETYANAEYGISYTFSGNKMVMEAGGSKYKFIYEIKGDK